MAGRTHRGRGRKATPKTTGDSGTGGRPPGPERTIGVLRGRQPKRSTRPEPQDYTTIRTPRRAHARCSTPESRGILPFSVAQVRDNWREFQRGQGGRARWRLAARGQLTSPAASRLRQWHGGSWPGNWAMGLTRVRAVFFDLDNTLIDTAGASQRGMSEVTARPARARVLLCLRPSPAAPIPCEPADLAPERPVGGPDPGDPARSGILLEGPLPLSRTLAFPPRGLGGSDSPRAAWS